MGAKRDPKGSKQVDAAVEAANKVNVVLKANAKFTFGKDGLGQKEFEQAMQDAQDTHAQFLTKDAERNTAKSARKTSVRQLRTLVTLARSGIRSYFGLDSDEYKNSGCTKASDRKKPQRKNGNGNGHSQPSA